MSSMSSMSSMSKLKEKLISAKKAQKVAKRQDKETRIKALKAIAKSLLDHEKDIIAANKKDLERAASGGLSKAMIDRLTLHTGRIKNMAKDVLAIADQEEVLGLTGEEAVRENKLSVKKERIPIGVIGMVFESRPNVIVDAGALAIKSGNAIILKGGKEAQHSNTFLGELLRNAIKDYLPEDVIVVLDSQNRELVQELICQKDYVDLIIPRGGEALIHFVYENAKVPVIAHFKGLCHTYIDVSCDLVKAKDIIINAKTNRPGVCNAMETLLLHKDLDKEWVKGILYELCQKGVELRLDEKLHPLFASAKRAEEKDWDEEYLDLILSVKQVDSVNEAILHIDAHGSYHTEAIVAEDRETIELFTKAVDCSCLVINASSRFNDGGQLGLGAELGISTTKLHAYGPMGAKEMTTTRFVVVGDGQIRD